MVWWFYIKCKNRKKKKKKRKKEQNEQPSQKQRRRSQTRKIAWEEAYMNCLLMIFLPINLVLIFSIYLTRSYGNMPTTGLASSDLTIARHAFMSFRFIINLMDLSIDNYLEKLLNFQVTSTQPFFTNYDIKIQQFRWLSLCFDCCSRHLLFIKFIVQFERCHGTSHGI